jgi:SulP family sulfate permease
MFVPQLVTCLRSYTRRQFYSDLTAGLVVGVVALPLAMAFAIASGLPPERGLYTAIVAGFLIAALGGSRVQIGGPTGAFVVVVYDIVQRHGVAGLTVCTIMAGLLLIGLGLARLGAIIKFIPYPVITGFTSGIAVIIFSSQIKDLFGMTTGPVPSDFLGKWAEYSRNLHTVNPAALGVSALCVGVLVFWPRAWRRVPSSVVAMLLATALVQIFRLPVETIGSRFGDIPARLPPLSWPTPSLDQIRNLIGPAITVALLAGIESLLSAVVADGMTGRRHDSNTELIAQGIANVCSPLFGGLPATGAIARTATNVRNGASTPVAGMVHALTLFAIMLLFGRWARLVPMCCLAAVLVVVAYNMSEWRSFRALLRAPWTDVAVLLISFGLTVVFDLALAVQLGVVLAAFFFLKRMADVTNVDLFAGGNTVEAPARAAEQLIPRGVQIYEMNGPLFFAATDKVREALSGLNGAPRVLILSLRQVPLIDATGLHTLDEVRRNCAEHGTRLILCGVRHQPLRALHRSGGLKALGKENVVPNLDRALDGARRTLGLAGLPRRAPEQQRSA